MNPLLSQTQPGANLLSYGERPPSRKQTMQTGGGQGEHWETTAIRAPPFVVWSAMTRRTKGGGRAPTEGLAGESTATGEAQQGNTSGRPADAGESAAGLLRQGGRVFCGRVGAVHGAAPARKGGGGGDDAGGHFLALLTIFGVLYVFFFLATVGSFLNCLITVWSLLTCFGHFGCFSPLLRHCWPC